MHIAVPQRIRAIQAAAPPRRLRWRVGLRWCLGALVLGALLPLVAFSIWAVEEAIDGQKAAARARLMDTARVTALFVESEIDTRTTALRLLASSPLMDVATEDCRFHDWAAQVGRSAGTWVVLYGPANETGHHPQLLNTRLPCGAALPVNEPNPSLEAVFRTGRPGVSNLYVGTVVRRHLFTVFVPVVRDGAVAIVVGMPVLPEQITTVLKAAAPSPEMTLSVINASRTVVARLQNEAAVGSRVPPATVAAAAGLSSGFVMGLAADGRELAIGFQRLGSAPGWTAVAGLPAQAYEGAWRGPADRLLVGGLLALGAALLIGAFIARRVLRPIRYLTTAAHLAREGDAKGWSEPHRSGVAEFDRLAIEIGRAQLALARRTAAMARKERRYRALAEVGTLTAWLASPHGETMEAHGWEALTGEAPGAACGDGWLEAVHPEDRVRVGAAWKAALVTATPLDIEYRIRWAGSEHEWRWVRSKGVPVRSRVDGPIEEWVGVVEDAHERRSQEERQTLLAREVDHRAKNALAVVQSALRLTRATDVPSYVRAVEGRVHALARAHSLLAEKRWTGADLHALLRGELAPFLAEGAAAPRVVLDGPEVALPATVAQPVGMFVHELATNAVKHGALSVAGGRVDVSWNLDRTTPGHVLTLRWAETGGPPVPDQPARRGFGTRVLDATIRNQLGGVVAQRWEASGLVCDICLPLQRKARDGGADEAAADGGLSARPPAHAFRA